MKRIISIAAALMLLVGIAGGEIVANYQLNYTGPQVDAALANMAALEAGDITAYLENNDALNVGSPAGTYANLAALIAADPDPSKIYITLDNSNWCYHNGTTWAAGGVYQATAIADESVKITSLLDANIIDASPNLFNKSTATLGGFIQYTTGTWNENPSYAQSDYIEVDEGVSYVSNISRYVVYYDSNKNYLSGLPSGWTSLIIPTGVKYVRFALSSDELNTTMFAKHSLPSRYFSYDDITYSLKNLKFNEANFEEVNNVIPLKTIKEYTPGKNMFDKTNVTIGAYPNWETGGLIYYTGFNASDYIPVEEGQQYTLSRSAHYVIYDIEKGYVTGGDTISSVPLTITIPPNGAFIRLSAHDLNIDTLQFEKGSAATSYEAFHYYLSGMKLNVNDIIGQIDQITQYWYGKIVNITGDSITIGVGVEAGSTTFSDITANSLGIVTMRNYGISSSTIAVKESDPTTRTPIVSRYTSMNNDADLVIVAAGTNDWTYSWTPIGSMADRVNTTFYGALHNLCIGLVEKYTGKQLLFMTPIKRKTDTYPTQESQNANGKTLQQYAEIIKEVCAYYGIPVLDMYNECLLNPHIVSQSTAYIPDGTHPNAEGHKIMARRLTGYLKQLA